MIEMPFALKMRAREEWVIVYLTDNDRDEPGDGAVEVLRVSRTLIDMANAKGELLALVDALGVAIAQDMTGAERVTVRHRGPGAPS